MLSNSGLVTDAWVRSAHPPAAQAWSLGGPRTKGPRRKRASLRHAATLRALQHHSRGADPEAVGGCGSRPASERPARFHIWYSDAMRWLPVEASLGDHRYTLDASLTRLALIGGAASLILAAVMVLRRRGKTPPGWAT